MSKNVAAYTAEGINYPAFVGVTELDDGDYVITVRSEGNGGKDIAEIILSPEAFKALLQTLNENILDGK